MDPCWEVKEAKWQNLQLLPRSLSILKQLDLTQLLLMSRFSVDWFYNLNTEDLQSKAYHHILHSHQHCHSHIKCILMESHHICNQFLSYNQNNRLLEPCFDHHILHSDSKYRCHIWLSKIDLKLDIHSSLKFNSCHNHQLIQDFRLRKFHFLSKENLHRLENRSLVLLNNSIQPPKHSLLNNRLPNPSFDHHITQKDQ